MFKLLIRHFVYEKAIDVLFNRIFRNFPNKPKFYKKVFVKNDEAFDDSILVVMYNVYLSEIADTPDTYAVQFEYFKYCDGGHINDWKHEINMSTPVKPPNNSTYYDILKHDITKKV